jgi:DNA-directed RNA polymerase beta subunit
MKTTDDILGDAPPPITFHEFGDADSLRSSIFDKTMKAMSTAYPIENTKHRLEVRGLKWEGPERYSLKEQKKAVMQGDTLERKLTGTWALVDKATGQVVDKKQTTVAHLPWATDRGTFVYRGNEYVVANQTRLRPGVYARVKDNGILEAHVNAKIGTGPSFRVYMEPDTGIFRLAVGQSTLKLYPLLREMGVSDTQIEKSWGNDLLRKNVEADDPRAVQRAFNKLVGDREEPPKED